MSNFLNAPLQPITIRPRRNIGGIEATVTMSERSTDEVEITKHPVQRGADVTDNAFKKQALVDIEAMWNDQILSLIHI